MLHGIRGKPRKSWDSRREGGRREKQGKGNLHRLDQGGGKAMTVPSVQKKRHDDLVVGIEHLMHGIPIVFGTHGHVG